jgi:hypothetical protein
MYFLHQNMCNSEDGNSVRSGLRQKPCGEAIAKPSMAYGVVILDSTAERSR